MKVCFKCQVKKEFSEFHKDKCAANGFRSSCKICVNSMQSSYDRKILTEDRICLSCKETKITDLFVKNRKVCLDCNKIYKRKYNYPKKKKEKLEKERKIITIKNKTKEQKIIINLKQNKWRNNRMNTDILYKTKEQIRKLIYKSFKTENFKKNTRTYEILGCTFEEFKNYIESKFEYWMNWDNHGNYTGNYMETWQYDHIIPISSGMNIEEIIKLNHFTNFQPLCSKINLCDKNRKINY